MSLKKLAMLGIASALVTSCSGGGNGAGDNKSHKEESGELTEDQLIDKLSDVTRELYLSLDEDGRALALELANQKCAGNNKCAGLNSCKTDRHECAGQGNCKGQSKCAFEDKNMAVKVAAKKMAEKRIKSILNPQGYNQNPENTPRAIAENTAHWETSWNDEALERIHPENQHSAE